MIAQAAQERATLPERDRLPVMVYIDEAQDYFDQNIGVILSQARKFRVGMTLAHQYLGQLSGGLQEAVEANTAIKMAGGVCARRSGAGRPDERRPGFDPTPAEGHLRHLCARLDRAGGADVLPVLRPGKAPRRDKGRDCGNPATQPRHLRRTTATQGRACRRVRPASACARREST